jgi:hypothetical protein
MSDTVIPIVRTVSTSQSIEEKYPTEFIDLPSQGFYYDSTNPLSKGVVEIKMMTARDEDILTNENYVKRGIVLDELLKSVIVDKSIDIATLLLGDINALFIACRRFAYGDKYGPLQVKCRACGATNTKTINLGEIKAKEIELDASGKGDGIFTFTLPYSKKTVKVKLMRNSDESKISDELKALSKISKTTSAEITTRLKHMIVQVDGQSDRGAINKFVDNYLQSRDSLALRAFIDGKAPDLNITFEFQCEHCQGEERMGVPMTAQFFWPDA